MASEEGIFEESVIAPEQSSVAVLPPTAKDPRSKAKYNLISRLLFCWIGGLLRYGFNHHLEISDLYTHPSEADSEKLHRMFSKYWGQELYRRSRRRTPRLWMVIVKCFWWRFLLQGLIAINLTLMNVAQAVMVGLLTRYFNLPLDKRDRNETRNAYFYGTGLVSLGLVMIFFHSHGLLIGQVIGMMSRIMMISAIYDKVLSLSQVTIGTISVGHIINLASNDVQRFDMAFTCVHQIWVAPLHLILTIYLIYREIGLVAFVIVSLPLVVLPLQFFLSRMFANISCKAAKVTDKRVRIMNEIITGIRLIKMNAWEYAFKTLVNNFRRDELKLINYGGIIRNLSYSFILAGVEPLILGVIFIIFIGTGGILTTQRLFTTLSLFTVLNRTCVIYLVRLSFQLYEASVSIGRIQALLLLQNILSIEDMKDFHDDVIAEVGSSRYFELESLCQPGRNAIVDEDSAVKNSKSSFVNVTALSVSWTNTGDKMVLKGITFKLDHTAPFLSVIGPVGSGKSTLLNCLLGELEIKDGSVAKSGRISYTAQDPWVFSGSVRENILLNLPYHKEWYQRVVNACALDKDICIFLNGDLTLVGERGVTLSGGQKARVCLARAVYRDADIYFLDDPLSAVDTIVGKHLFDRCLRGILKNKLVILVTHHVHFALQADQLLALKDGMMHIYGTCTELSERNIAPDQLFELIMDKENDPDGKCSDNEGSIEEGSDQEEVADSLLSHYSTHSLLSSETELETSQHADQNDAATEEKAQGSISMKTYYRYFVAGGNYFVLFVVIVFFILGESGKVLGDWWLSNWSSCFDASIHVNVTVPQTCSISRNNRFIIFSSLIFTVIFLSMLRGVLLYLVCSNASEILHNRMFATILRTPILFFDSNPSGRVLNRFSKDVGLVDDVLPTSFLIYLMVFLHCIAIVILASTAVPYILIPLPFVIVAFIVLRWYYLRSSRDIKRLEALARSPVYSHISATLQGLPTIRIFEQYEVAFKKMHYFNNEHTKGWYLHLVALRWFGIRLDFLCNLLLIGVVFLSIPLVAHTVFQPNSALLGLGLTYTVSLTRALQYSIRHSAIVENLMVSTERIMAYCHLKPEASLETQHSQDKPPDNWPDKGMITMEDVSFKYFSGQNLILKHLNFSLRPSEKVGIVGRSGSGKSSLISAIFRLAESSGHISIDGVDIKSIGLHDLRKKITVISQDPVLFSGTVRYNLDPFMEYSDLELWEVLDHVQIKGAVEQMEDQLSGNVSEGGKNFSVGQRQLLCLARALLKKNTILILDEATADVDHKTGGIIQQAIKLRVIGCTVLTIAHRLKTIMDSDRILVMSNGRIKEFASPYELLQNSRSLFYKMVEKTGPDTSQMLHQMAMDAKSKISS